MLQCTSPETASCLSAAHVAAVKANFGGPCISADVPLYAPFHWDGGFDSLAPLVDSVGDGNAPDTILASAPADTPWPGLGRPLCPYPDYARYFGNGSLKQA